MNCGCNPVSEPFEFEVKSASYINPSKIELPYGNDLDLCALRNTILNDYCDILNKLLCGIQLDLEYILEKISIMDINNNCSFNSLKQIYPFEGLSECSDNEELIELVEEKYKAISTLLNKKIGYIYKDEELEKYLCFTSEEAYNLYKTTNNSTLILATIDVTNSGIGYISLSEDKYLGFKNEDKYNEYLNTHNEALIIAEWPIPSTDNKIGYVKYEDGKLYLYSYQGGPQLQVLENLPFKTILLDVETLKSNITNLTNSVDNRINNEISNINENISNLTLALANFVKISNYEVPEGIEMISSYKKVDIENLPSYIIKVWEPKQLILYRVDFYSDNSLVQTDNYYSGATLLWPTNVSKARHKLNYWTTNNTNYTTEHTYIVNKDTRFDAVWEKIKFIINYIPNNGTSIDSIEIDKGNTITLPNISYNGYSFKGWYLTSNFNGTPLGQTYTPLDDVTFYAKWIKLYTITFNTNGGSSINLITVDTGTLINLNEKVTTKTGYIFSGWYDNNSFTGNPLTSYTVTENKTFYAKWIEETKYLYLLYRGDINLFNPSNLNSLTDELELKMKTNNLTFKDLVGWSSWADSEGLLNRNDNDKLYIILPKKSNTNAIEDYLTAENLGSSLLADNGFKIDDTINSQSHIFILWNGRKYFSDGNADGVIIFK